MDDKVTRLILEALRDGDRSGYEVWRWLNRVRGVPEGLTEANLYPILYTLEARRVIRGDSREAEGVTRRVYRVAGRGIDLATKQGWVAVTLHGATRSSTQTTLAGPDVQAAADGNVQSALGEYVSKLEAGLRLSSDHLSNVAIEIRDHLGDSVGDIAKSGSSYSEAAAEAVARLGPPETLAEAISLAQLTRRRLLRGIRFGGYQAVLAGTIGLGGGGLAVLLTPYIARSLADAAATVGVHLYVPETAEWRDQQFMAIFWLAAFMAGRISLPRVAIESWRTEADVKVPWALGGVAILALVVLLVPAALDFLVVVSLLGVPLAFAVGVWRCQGAIDDPISKRGAASAALLLAVLLLTPGFRTFAFDAGAVPPGNPSPAASSTMSFTWTQTESGASLWHVGVDGLDVNLWHDPAIEFWTTQKQGPLISPDDRATRPTLVIAPGGGVDLTIFPTASDLWVTLTATGSDGQRHTLHSELHAGPPSSGLNDLLGWIRDHF